MKTNFYYAVVILTICSFLGFAFKLRSKVISKSEAELSSQLNLDLGRVETWPYSVDGMKVTSEDQWECLDAGCIYLEASYNLDKVFSKYSYSDDYKRSYMEAMCYGLETYCGWDFYRCYIGMQLWYSIM